MTTEKRLLGVNPSGGDKPNVEDVFSTYLYEGTGSAQTITNGIDLDGEGGLVWIKMRDDSNSHRLYDTERGATKSVSSNDEHAEFTSATSLTSFNSTGFSIGGFYGVNGSGMDLTSWTFRKAPKFFDVVTYTGNSVNGRTIPHSLDATVGMILIKNTTSGYNWIVYHDSLSANGNLVLNNTHGERTSEAYFSTTKPTSTEFGLNGSDVVNGTGQSYVAYLFADNSAEDADEQMIQCGSGVTDAAAEKDTITLGWEPQYVLVKRTDSGGNWEIYDSMRGFGADDEAANDKVLQPNLSGGDTGAGRGGIHADGFTVRYIGSNADYIYMAIRGPMMKEPESATDVFAIDTANSTGNAPPVWNSGFPVDMAFYNGITGGDKTVLSRMTGGQYLKFNATNAEAFDNNGWDFMDGWYDGSFTNSNFYAWMWKRAKGFFDVVAYNGSGSARDISHSLGVEPEMLIVKRRESNGDWDVWHKDITQGCGYRILLHLTNPVQNSGNSKWCVSGSPDMNASTFSLGTDMAVNNASGTYIAYLFASLDGISKVGSYTGSSSSVVNVDCGFSNGARFVLIKRTDSNGDWMVFDTERGIVTGNDPLLNLNNTDAEWSGGDLLDPYSSGFSVNPNWSGSTDNGTYIFLAIA